MNIQKGNPGGQILIFRENVFCSLRSTKEAAICSNVPTNKKISIFFNSALGVGLTRIPM